MFPLIVLTGVFRSHILCLHTMEEIGETTSVQGARGSCSRGMTPPDHLHVTTKEG